MAQKSRLVTAPREGWRQRLGSRRVTGWLLVAPCVIVILGIGVFPLLYSLGISFLGWDPRLPGKPLIWFDNYGNVLKDVRFWQALEHTLILVVGAVTIQFFLGLGLANLLIEPLKGKRFILPALLLPVMAMPVVVGFTWKMLWDGQYGPINQVLGWFVRGDVHVSWLSKPITAFPAIIITDVWQWTPFMFLVLLAALSGVPSEIYDSAAVDGASGWKTFWRISLPMIKPVIIIALLIRGLDAFKMFDLVFTMTLGGPGTSSETTPYYLYRLGFEFFRLSYTAAGSYIFMIMLSIVATIILRRFFKASQRT